ncbi:MAG: HDIG domain-containing protein [Bacteroidota bacterium]|nr:HDIG domain-containing protein [Bacteroidota bacterium]
MKQLISFIRNNYANIYKGLLFVAAVFLIVSLFPKEGKFRYEYKRSKPWIYEDLIAPFDFAIIKSEDELKDERQKVLRNEKLYFRYDENIGNQKNEYVRKNFDSKWEQYMLSNKQQSKLYGKFKLKNEELCLNILDSIFKKGIIRLNAFIENKDRDYEIIILRKNVAEVRKLGDIFTVKSANDFINYSILNKKFLCSSFVIPFMSNLIAHNLSYDPILTYKIQQSLLNNISITQGMIQNGELVISKGEVVTTEKFKILESLKFEYEKQLGRTSNYYFIDLGQIILISISILVLVLFLYSFRKDVFADNKRILFLLLLIYIMVLIVSRIIKYDIKYLYLIPLSIVPIIIRTFFDTRIALFVHLVMLAIIGFLVPNSFEFVFLQLISGIVAVISVAHMNTRLQLFKSAGLIFLIYCAAYLGLSLTLEGKPEDIKIINFIYLAINATFLLFAYPLFFIFEKLFGFTSDLTLLELADTNNKLLRDFAARAPGTFQHCVQVANLAEEAIYKIGGNGLMVRAGALYHDIGKMDMPMYFIENKVSGINPYDELQYTESAGIIKSHVIKGIEIARKNKLPEIIIDFIRTHHGTTKTQYFYQNYLQELQEGETIDIDAFTYHGPIPFSKETAVLMMADSVEAASRALRSYDPETIDSLVENIIDRQIEEKQFVNADITFKDIKIIKKILKKKLLSIYHLRIAYPG